MEAMVRWKVPPHVHAVQWGGEEFVVKNGHVVLPMAANRTSDLTTMGFEFPDHPSIVYKGAAERPIPIKSHGRR